MINSSLSYSRVSDRDYFNDFGNSLSTVSESSVKEKLDYLARHIQMKVFIVMSYPRYPINHRQPVL